MNQTSDKRTLVFSLILWGIYLPLLWGGVIFFNSYFRSFYFGFEFGVRLIFIILACLLIAATWWGTCWIAEIITEYLFDKLGK